MTESAFLVRNPCFAQIAMVIPQARIQDALDALGMQIGHAVIVAAAYLPVQGRLARLLEQLGWEYLEQKDGSIHLTGYTGRELDLERDPVLVSAVGIVSPGSFLLGQSSHELAPTWWVSYTEQEKQVNSGTPTPQQVEGLLVCPACGSFDPRGWHHIQYTAISYPVLGVNPARIETVSQGEIAYEDVNKEYLECSCGAEIERGGREIV